MTDTTETIVTPDPHAIARAVLLEVADESDQVGDFVTSYDLEEHVTDFRFAANIRGYEGWQWSVTLYHDEEIDSWTVNESSLISTEDALMPPKWIPWKDRLEPTVWLPPIRSVPIRMTSASRKAKSRNPRCRMSTTPSRPSD